MFSAVDPIPMVQLINILGDEYVVWDKSAEIFFKRPAKENLYAEFIYTPKEIENIQKQVAAHSEIEILKKLSNFADDEQFKIFLNKNQKNWGLPGIAN